MVTGHVALLDQKEYAEISCLACFLDAAWIFKPIKEEIVTNYSVFAAQNGHLHLQDQV
jgi:hypothetical protein